MQWEIKLSMSKRYSIIQPELVENENNYRMVSTAIFFRYINAKRCLPNIIVLGPKLKPRNYRQIYAQDHKVLPGILDYYDGIILHLSILS